MPIDALTPDSTVAEFAAAWLDEYVARRLRHTTEVTYRRAFGDSILPVIGEIPLSALTRDDCQRVVDEAVARGNLAATTVRANVWMPMSSALGYARENHLLRFNPASNVRLPRRGPRGVRALSREEAQRYLHCALLPLGTGGHFWYGPLAAAALHTGMRLGELRGLRWNNVHLFEEPEDGMAGVISVCEQIDTSRTRAIWDKPKSAASFRDVPIPTDLATVLIAHRERVDTFARRKGTRKWTDLELVFPSMRGTVAGRDSVTQTRRRIAKLADVDPAPTFHAFRHTYASMLVEAGIEAPIVAELMGHADVGVTINTYYDASHEARQKASVAIASLMGGNQEREGHP